MKQSASPVILVTLTLLSHRPGLGAVVTFDSLTAAVFHEPFSTYSEAGFTANSTTGSWMKAVAYGNPVPNIFVGPDGGQALPGSITVTGPALFTFTSVDFSSNVAPSGYALEGFRNNVSQFLQSGSLPTANSVFQTILGSNSSPIDQLVISLSPGTDTDSVNVDNITVSSVPEPGTRTMDPSASARVQ